MKKNIPVIILLALYLGSSTCFAEDSRQDPRQGRLQGAKEPFKNETCGNMDDLARKVEICSQPLMGIIEGTTEKWPANDNDVHDLCLSFVSSEKCIKDLGRRCAKGLQKTILSVLANSVQRARKRECSRPKYPNILKTTNCMNKHQALVGSLISNATNYLDIIEHQMRDLDKKTTALCCMVSDMEDSIRILLTPRCPEEVVMVVRLYRAILQDVIELVCRNPKCKDIFRGYKVVPLKYKGGIVSVLLRIVFSLG